ncbi:Response regulator [Candidatus Bealeia paramacronuclearis]|uniref:Response regulator n=1 Tax=Candidatus Bealeia paramacronuclearis TaxID=1921001 RepID=A0ABZ2C3Z5_9PROT|nr:Response regulator [Candidatus Bealeia paramacronuclearis]
MSNPSVLIVEDNEMNMKLCCDLLEAHDISYITTGEGQKALELAEKKVPTVILLDIQLPDISGEEVLNRLKSDLILKHIPVIVITAFASPLDQERFKTLGCDAYLPKPLTIESFFGTLLPYLGEYLIENQSQAKA